MLLITRPGFLWNLTFAAKRTKLTIDKEPHSHQRWVQSDDLRDTEIYIERDLRATFHMIYESWGLTDSGRVA